MIRFKIMIIPVSLDLPIGEFIVSASDLLEVSNGLPKLVGDRDDTLITPVRRPDGGAFIWVNEEGIALGLPFNPRASAIATAWRGEETPLVGAAFITGALTTGVPEDAPDDALGEAYYISTLVEAKDFFSSVRTPTV